MRPDRREIETIARVRELNHEVQQMMVLVRTLDEPEDGPFRDRISANYDEMRLAMGRI